MTYAELMSKLKKGEALTAEEVAEFEKLSRPAERFNEVAAKAQKLESDFKAKEAELEALKTQKLDEAQRMQDEVQRQLAELGGKVETLSADNAKLLSERDDVVKSLKVRDLAANNPTGAVFADPDYLKYIFDREKIDLNDGEKVKATILSLKEKMPEQFKVAAKGGSGAGMGNFSNGSPQKIPKTDAEKAEFIKNGGTVEQYMALAASAESQEK